MSLDHLSWLHRKRFFAESVGGDDMTQGRLLKSTLVVAIAVYLGCFGRYASGQDIRVLERQMRQPSRQQTIRDRQNARRRTIDWQQRSRRFNRQMTNRARDERREARNTTVRVRSELNVTARTQKRGLDNVVRNVEQESRQDRRDKLNVTRNEQQAAYERISERIRADNRTRNDERRERRQQMLERIRGTLRDIRKANQEAAEQETAESEQP